MEVPPKLVGSEVVKRERGITMHPHAGALREGKDSLPVLGAFGEFIEDERRRSRTRMLVLSGFFLLILTVVVGAGILVGMLFFDRVRSDVLDVQSEVNGVRAQIEAKYDRTHTSLAKLESETRSLLDGLAQHEEALSNTREAVDSQKHDYDQELADMKQLVDLLEVENTAIKKDMQLVASRWPRLAESVDRLRAAVGDLPEDVASVKTAVDAGTKAEPALPTSFEFLLLPAGGARKYSWRLPIPE